MTKIEAQELLKVWTARRDAATPRTGKAQLALLVEDARWAFRCERYDSVGRLLSEAMLQRQLEIW